MGREHARRARFATLFERLYPALCRFLEGMLGRSGKAEELAQESLLRLYRSRVPDDQARFWVFRVARNLALNEIRRTAGFARQAPLRLVAPADPPTPEDHLRDRQELALVWRSVRELPERQRAALLLRETEQMSYAQIAEVLGISIDHVKVSLFRARRTVRDRWRRRSGLRSAGAKP